MNTHGFEEASRHGAQSLDRYVTEISTFKDSLIIRAYTSSIRGAVTQILGENASVALAQTARNHAGLLGSADIELVVTTQDTISKAEKKSLGLVAARAVFVDLRFTYTATIGRQVITLQPLTPDLPSVDIAFQSPKWQKGENCENGRGSYTAAKLHAARTAVKALNIMQHIYSLPKVPGQDLEQIVIVANWEVEGEPSFTQYLENSLDSIAAHSVSKAWREAALTVSHLLKPDPDAPAAVD
ncbi:hypothetical protein COCOBI_01-1820 [Coccomyxa sp. Obi]|nr:hypothetical protein COCOBI_01-1820 [Coccomyxa sp. Obi]